MTDLLAESDIDEAPEAGDTEKLRKVHDRIMRRFDSVATPQIDVRANALEARRFITIPGAMWEGDVGEQFENSPRPEIDKITKSLEKIETDYRENRLTVNFLPADNGDRETAETLNGMYRADATHFKAQQSRDNAFREAIRGGFGAFRITTDYADPYDPDNDSQRVNPGVTIVDADQSVYFDGGAVLYDKSDAKWAFIVTADERADAEEAWGSDVADWPLVGKWDWNWEWYTADVVYKVEYYETEDTTDKLLIFTQEQSGEEQRFFETELDADEIRDLKAQGWKPKTRPIKRKRVRKYIANGSRILRDCGYIAGPNIPIVPVYGKCEWVDGKEWFRGHVQKWMDAQRSFNTAIARIQEAQGMAPYPVPIVYAEQLNPDIIDEWASGNIERKPLRRLLAMRDENGNPLTQQPTVTMLPGSQVEPSAAAILQIVGSELAGEDDTADKVKSNVSADAMDMAAQRVDSKSGIYLDNMRQSEQRAAEIYRGMGREVYYEPGREVETMTLDGQEGKAELVQATMDGGVYKIRNDLTVGGYKVVADVQESTATKRQKAMRQGMELGQAFMAAQSPQDALAAFYTAAENMDGEGIGDLLDFYRQKSIGIGATKPTPEEKKAIEAAAQEKGQQPDPQQIALQAATKEADSKAALNAASAADKQASAVLKTAQAATLGGPEKAPEVPTGLSAANDIVDIHAKTASANLHNAQADHLRDQMQERRVRTGHEIEMDRRSHALEQRRQDHAENTVN